MDTRTGDIYESKEAATTAGVPDAQGEAPAAAAAPEAALATAQAERSEALMECNCAVLERDAALQRAEQAEAALAQAQKEAATCRHNYAVLCETGQRNEAAQPPALPPLPEGWEEEHDGAVVRFTTQSRNTEMGVVADRYDVRFITPWRMVPKINVADLLIVLRHAEAAHQRLKEGHRG